MTAITFPTDPANGELYTAPNGCVYIWDGEKWVVNSTIYTGQELANISQDRVAPMFVNGVNTGITFTYNSTTNVMTSTVTGGSADTGDWAFTGNVAYNGTSYDQGLYIAPGGEGVSYIFVPGNSESATVPIQIGNTSSSGQVSVAAYNKQWQFEASGALVYPNTALQRDTGSVSCPGNASTVVYASIPESNRHTIKLLIQVEGFEGANDMFDTQACEMIIAKSFRANALAASVYGVVHTSVAPLATFTANWNALTGSVEVICTAPSANSVNVRIFATEITTSD